MLAATPKGETRVETFDRGIAVVLVRGDALEDPRDLRSVLTVRFQEHDRAAATHRARRALRPFTASGTAEAAAETDVADMQPRLKSIDWRRAVRLPTAEKWVATGILNHDAHRMAQFCSLARVLTLLRREIRTAPSASQTEDVIAGSNEDMQLALQVLAEAGIMDDVAPLTREQATLLRYVQKIVRFGGGTKLPGETAGDQSVALGVKDIRAEDRYLSYADGTMHEHIAKLAAKGFLEPAQKQGRAHRWRLTPWGAAYGRAPLARRLADLTRDAEPGGRSQDGRRSSVSGTIFGTCGPAGTGASRRWRHRLTPP